MPEQQSTLSREFIAQQRSRLEALRRQVLGGELSATSRRRSFEELHGDEAAEFEDQAQDSAQEEVRQAQHDVDDQRVADIERALQKIDDGTYGYSDISGDPIPQARLEATPEAIVTIEEAQAREQRR
ncbi:TraR/DksA family transcriptional regulator [Dyella soli]|uniref:TraR/DksA family transcriptional regulator n=1 Tax=Dyella soli TaxID=522319 RepID=A0A4R0YU82_9GAMM|nr:TraR/DksA family transcriptional regulator [Dyella soli]TCI10062.1 TraR/DksA family transcriptional regulator [Dyella soli]